jgi:hypothetical protein
MGILIGRGRFMVLEISHVKNCLKKSTGHIWGISLNHARKTPIIGLQSTLERSPCSLSPLVFSPISHVQSHNPSLLSFSIFIFFN